MPEPHRRDRADAAGRAGARGGRVPPRPRDGPFQQMMEVWVEAMRGETGAAVVAAFDDATARRVASLRAMTPEQLDEVGWSPIGEVPYREFMVVRLFDCWMHEQDIRRAVGRPGNLSGPVVDRSLDRFRAALGFVVGKKAGAHDGSSVVIITTGETELVLPVVVDGRARLVDPSDAPDEPTVTITLPFTTFVALGGGRWSAAEANEAGGVVIEGDTDLGDRVLANLGFTP
ncbi:MAG: maleylpyruvate isomerase family mycothiol-dependent enzyme [Acidimicrobiales bacterium]